MPKLPIFPASVHNVKGGHLRRTHASIGSIQGSETLEAVMGAIAILHYEIIAHHSGIFFAAGELAILERKTFGVFAQSIVNDVFQKGNW